MNLCRVSGLSAFVLWCILPGVVTGTGLSALFCVPGLFKMSLSVLSGLGCYGVRLLRQACKQDITK